MTNTFLIVDAQIDFCEPTGSLFVPGADVACENISKLLRNCGNKFDSIAVSLDWHPISHISFPNFWLEDVELFKTYSTKSLTPINHYPNMDSEVTIFLEHTIVYTEGSNIQKLVQSELEKIDYKNVYYAAKGMSPQHEEFSAFHCLSWVLNQSDKIYVSGVATEFCVRATILDMIAYGMGKKIVLLGDCVASIPGYEDLESDLYDKILSNGGQIQSSQEIAEQL